MQKLKEFVLRSVMNFVFCKFKCLKVVQIYVHFRVFCCSLCNLSDGIDEFPQIFTF